MHEQMGYLALRLGSNPRIYSTDTTASTGGGAVSTTGAGFEPNFLIGIGSGKTTAFDTVTDGGSMGIGFTNGTYTYSLSSHVEDGQATSDTASRVTNDHFWSVDDDDGTIEYEADFDSFDSDGWTLDYGTASPSGYRQAFLAIRAAGIGAELIQPDAAAPGMKIANPTKEVESNVGEFVGLWNKDFQMIVEPTPRKEKWFPNKTLKVGRSEIVFNETEECLNISYSYEVTTHNDETRKFEDVIIYRCNS